MRGDVTGKGKGKDDAERAVGTHGRGRESAPCRSRSTT